MIPRKRQAAPQAPARDFKPRKNGTPAVPATPPANMPRQAPAPQQPPMRGAAQSMGQPPQQQRAPQRAPQRAQGRFNPMQGPMGADMGRARQAAASMFMDRAPKPMQPSMPPQPKTPPPAMPQRQMQTAAQSAMQRAPQRAPLRQRTSQTPDLSPAQQAAIDIAGMMPGPQFARFAPGQPGEPESDESGGMSFSSLPTVSADALGALPDTSILADAVPNPYAQAIKIQYEQAKSEGKGYEYIVDQLQGAGYGMDDDYGTNFFGALDAMGVEPKSFANEYIVKNGGSPEGDMAFIMAFGRGAYDALFGVGTGPYGEGGASEKLYQQSMEEAYQEADEAGITSFNPDGTPKQVTVDPATSDTVLQALRDELQELLGSEGEGFFTDDELTAQGQLIQAQADEAATKLAQQMAMRGMGASGLAGAGFGGIAAQEFAELTDLAVQNKLAGDEARRANLAAIGQVLTGLQSDETRKELFKMGEEARKEETRETSMWNFLNNALGLTQSDMWDPESQALIMEDIANGVPYADIVADITFEEVVGADDLKYKKAMYKSGTGEPANLTGDPAQDVPDLGWDDYGFAYQEGNVNQKQDLVNKFVADKVYNYEPPPGFNNQLVDGEFGGGTLFDYMTEQERLQLWVDYYAEAGYEDFANDLQQKVLGVTGGGPGTGALPGGNPDPSDKGDGQDGQGGATQAGDDEWPDF